MAKKKHRGHEHFQGGPSGSSAHTHTEDDRDAEESPFRSGSVSTREIPEEYRLLVERLKDGKVVLCSGAALGASTGRPTWREIVGQLLDQLETQDTGKLHAEEIAEARAMLGSHPLSACGYVRRSLGDRFSQALLDVVPKNGALPEAVLLLSGLPFRAAVTTAYDDLLERAYAQGGKAVPSFSPSDVEEIKREARGRYILHVFGTPSKGTDVVFSPRDLQRVLADERFRKHTQELYSKRSFLFVGFDPGDPDFEILVDRVLAGVPAPDSDEPQHFAVLPNLGQVARMELLSSFGIRVLSASDVVEVAKILRDAVGDQQNEALPDDDDLEGWLRLLSQDPDRPEARLAETKLDALARKLHEAGDADRLIELWLGRIETESDGKKRSSGLRRIAELLENDKGQMAEAFHTMMEAYKEDPQAELLDELERLAGTTGQWVELLSGLRELTGQLSQLPQSERADVWVRIARLYGEKLDHVEYALASLAEAQKLDQAALAPPTRRQIRELRVELCRRAERWKDLADALGGLALDLSSDGRERERRIDLYLEQGEIYESRLSDGVSATTAFKKALETDPGSRDALSALEHLLRRHKSWPDLCDLLDRKVSLLKDAGDEAGSLVARREAASLATEHLGDRKAATERWEAIRRIDPEDLDALRALEKLHAQEGSYSEHYLSVLNSLAKVVPSDKERLTLYRRLAAEYEELPGHLPQAAAALERILDIDSTAEDAYRGLTRIYRQEKKWVLLVDTLRRQAKVVQSGKAEIFAAIGKIYETDLPSEEGSQADQALLAAPQAIEAYTQVLQLEPENKGALEALSKLYQVTESYDAALRIYDKRANLAEDKNDKINHLSEGAKIALVRLRDLKGAEERYVRALEADPHHVGTMLALTELYRRQGEYLRAAKLLTEAEGHTQNRLEKVKCLVDAAELYVQLEDPKKAADFYLKALAVDPEHIEAGTCAAELLYRQDRYQELLPILEMLTRKEGDLKELVRRLSRLGEAARKLDDTERALKAYTRAAEVDPSHLLAQRNKAELHFAKQHWQEAREAGKAVLGHHRDSLSAGEIVEIFYLVGECERHLDHKAEAKNFFAKALELEPNHKATRKAQLELTDLTPAERIEAKRALLSGLSGEARIKLLVEIGDLQREGLKDPDAAIDTYREALKDKPDSHLILHKCLDILSEGKRWMGVMEILETLIDLEQNPKRRAKYRQTAALIARDELSDPARAIALFSAALDDDATLERSATDLEKLALEQQDFRELARIYRRKIKWLGPDSETSTKEQRQERLRLWSALGQLCVEKLGDLETAMAAFEVCAALDRGNLERHRLLAALYIQAGPDRADKAIAEHQLLLRMNKAELPSYRALKRLYLQVKQRDKASHVAHALHILKKGEPDDEKLIAELKARPLTPARRPMKPELWRALVHPEEDLQLGALFQAVFPVVQMGYARPFKDVGINRKDRLEASNQQLYAKALRYGVEVLDAATPEAYIQPEQKERPYTVSHCAEKGQPAVICVQLGAQLINPRRPEREVMYEIGRLCALLRPKRMLRTLLPTAAQLALIIDATIAIGTKEAAPPKVAETAAGLKKALAPSVLEQIAAYGKSLAEAKVRGEAAATAWLGWSDLTAVRAGLVLAGDLETVALLLATDPPGSSPLAPKQRLLETLHFSVSEEYFTIRQHLGLMG